MPKLLSKSNLFLLPDLALALQYISLNSGASALDMHSLEFADTKESLYDSCDTSGSVHATTP